MFSKTIVHCVLAILACSLLVGSSFAQTSTKFDFQADEATILSLTLNPGFKSVRPEQSISIFKDPSKTLDVHDVLNLPTEQFVRERGNTFNSGSFSNSIFWFKVQIQSQQDLNILSEISFSTLKELSLYVINNGKIISQYDTGLARPFKQRPVKSNNFIFPISLKKDQPLTLLFSSQSDGPVIFPLTFWEERDYTENRISTQAIAAMYFGLVIALALYNLMLYFNIKDRAYLYYTLHLIVICWFQLSMLGYTPIYLWHDAHSDLPYREPTFTSLLTLSVVLQFARAFLRIKKHSARLERFLNHFSVFAFITFVFSLVAPFAIILPILFTSYTVCILTLIYCAIFALRRGERAARYFLVGWSILILGSVIQNLLLQDILPFNFFTEQSILLTSSFEAILMSIALADRINLMRKEKMQLQKLALETAQQSNELKDQFLATISHELRTPMNGVVGALDLVESQNLTQADRSAINVARLSSKRMLTLIDGILSYTEAQLEDIPLNKRLFKLPEDIHDLLAHVQDECRSRKISPNIDIRIENQNSFYGDIDKIRTILLHLTDNALKFTSDGSITIELSIHQSLEPSSTSRRLQILIKDTGIGISEEKAEPIFQAFNQIDAGYTRKHGGLGIGLALSKRLVTLLGGEMKMASKVGVGTSFELTIPIDALETREETTTPSNVVFVHKGHKPYILIAEDNAVNQKIMAALCAKLGYRTIVAINGEAAVTIAKQATPDLIFMDCQMPVMDGFEATQQIRLLNEALHTVPIVAVTANASIKDKQHCFAAGMNDHITKPVNLAQIRNCLLKWLPPPLHSEELDRRASRS